MDQLRRAVVEAIEAKPWLRSRIPIAAANGLFDIFDLRGELRPTLLNAPARHCRDPRDAYFLAHSGAGRADVLVTDDDGLLVLDGTFSFRILSPPDLLSTLREYGLI